MMEHYYNPAHSGLLDRGLKPHFITEEVLVDILELGRLVMTEGEPLTQWFRHKYLEVVTGGHDMDSERGMEEEEQYCMPRREIFAYLNTPPLRLIRHERFQWRLNNVYVAEKASGNRTF